ncbi:MAG TPA: VWA domain-containing protein [Kofleriaceae bacterium]|nr:VWA domain-containing protein [Kofleriaceae bacterium]
MNQASFLEELTFETPALVGIALAMPLVIFLIALADRARRRTLLGRLGEEVVVQRLMASVSPARRRIKRIVFALGVSLIVLAAARPQLPGQVRRGTEGLDLVIALDVSKSMLVDDVGELRLEKARRTTGKLIDALPGDRIAPMVFAGAAAHFPLTDDKSVSKQFLNDLGAVDLPPGSDVAEALKVASCLLRPDVQDAYNDDCAGAGGRGHGGDPLPGEDDALDDTATAEEVELEERAKVILLVTDGADGIGEGDDAMRPLEEVRRAVKLGVTVMVVGVGTTRGGNVPEIDYQGKPSGKKYDRDGKEVISKLDTASLRLLAQAGGSEARYFEWGTSEPDILAITGALATLKRGALQKKDERVMDELYHFFLFPGFLLLVIEACIGTRRRVRYPESR